MGIKEREKKISEMMVWNDGEEYQIGFFYRVVWKDVNLSGNFSVSGINYRLAQREGIQVDGPRPKNRYIRQILQNKKMAIRMSSSVS